MSIQSNFPAIAPSLLLDFANTKQLDNRITFTRSTPAVYYDGKTTAMAEQNLTLQSQTFDVSPWTNASISVTANATTAPDGTNTADKIIENNVNATHAVYQSMGTTSGLCTWSVYAKADTRSWLNLTTYVAGAKNTWFDLANGVVGTVASGCTATITFVGNGWYRCSVTTTGGSSTYFECWLANGDNVTSYAGDGTSGLFVWGAQLEQRSTATAYTVTTTQPITNYIPVLLSAGGNQARFDHNPTTGESLGLLIEEQRTNAATYSQSFNNAAYSKGDGVLVLENTVVAPDGTLTGNKLYTNTTVNGDHFLNHAGSHVPTTNSTVYTISVYAKAAEFGSYFIINADFNGYINTVFNLFTGTIVSIGSGATASITSVGNGWYRCTVSKTTGTLGYTDIALILNNNANERYYTGNGYSGVFIWGLQVEAGSFATSYIATTSASATRTADAASMTGTNFSSWFNQAEGTIYAEASSFINGTSIGRAVEIASSSSTTTITVGFRSEQTWVEAYYPPNPYIDSYSTGGLNSKISFAYATLSAARAIDGTTSTTSGVVYSYGQNATRLAFGSQNAASSQILNGWIKKVAYYPICITNTQLAALTS